MMLLIAIGITTWYRIGTKYQSNQYINNLLYLIVLTIYYYFTRSNTTMGLISPNFSFRRIVYESYKTFTVVHPIHESSQLICISHFVTYWFKIASWQSKSIRNLLIWQLLVETVSCFANEYTHANFEESTTTRCIRMAFITNTQHYIVDDMIRTYILPPFLVYGYLLPNFILYWIGFV